MRQLSRVLGAFLVGLSVFAVAQTVREILLWNSGARTYAEEHFHELPFVFGGRTFTVRDDKPFITPSSEADVDGKVQPLIDGQPLGPISRARVRPGRGHDLGRYHLWYNATAFRHRVTGQRTLWLTRRLQTSDAVAPRFEVTILDEKGTLRTRILPAWRLGSEYRIFRATQFIREGTWTTMPFSLTGAIGFFPIALLVFPIGTFLLGLRLTRYRSGASLRPAAG